MPKRFRLSLSIEDELIADDFNEAWDTFKDRVEDRLYGPTKDNIEDLGEVEEEE